MVIKTNNEEIENLKKIIEDRYNIHCKLENYYDFFTFYIYNRNPLYFDEINFISNEMKKYNLNLIRIGYSCLDNYIFLTFKR